MGSHIDRGDKAPTVEQGLTPPSDATEHLLPPHLLPDLQNEISTTPLRLDRCPTVPVQVPTFITPLHQFSQILGLGRPVSVHYGLMINIERGLTFS